MRPVEQTSTSSVAQPSSAATAAHIAFGVVHAGCAGGGVGAAAVEHHRRRPPAGEREVRVRGHHRGGGHLVLGEHGGRRDRLAAGGGHEAQVGVAGRLDPARHAARGEPSRGRHVIGPSPTGTRPTMGRPAASGRSRRRLAHCTAAPDAPLVRLSIAAIATTQPVRSSCRAVTWAQLEPRVALVEGDPSVTTTNGSSAYASRWRSSSAAVEVSPVGRGVAGGQDAPVHRRQVRREEHGRAERLLDLGRVPMIEQAVGREVLVHRAERRVRLRGAPCPGRTGRRVHDDPVGDHQPGAHERRQGQHRGRRVAARSGDVIGAEDLLPEELG